MNPISGLNPIGTGLTDYNAKGRLEEAKESQFEQALQKAVEQKDEKKLKEACKNLESVFVNMIFKQMRQSIPKSSLMDDDSAEETYEDMLYENYSKEITEGKGVGIADMLYKQLSKNIQPKSEDGNAK